MGHSMPHGEFPFGILNDFRFVFVKTFNGCFSLRSSISGRRQ